MVLYLMQIDTRTHNVYFKSFKEYTEALSNGLNRVDINEIVNARDLLYLTKVKGGRIFVAGNGGSAAISDHLCCDFIKGTYTDKVDGLQVQSLVGSMALLTATANDISYDKVFGYQMEMLKISSKDIVILISSSGNSKNIIDAMTTAQAYGAKVIGLTGFDGGLLRKFANVTLHIPCSNYGVVEDGHQAIMHYLSQSHYLAEHENIE